MTSRPLVLIPVKPFGVAKARLGPSLTAAQRSLLGMTVAARTASMADETEADVAVVTGDDAVADWAGRLGFSTIREPDHATGLDAAANAGVSEAMRHNRPWIVLHADLPMIRPHEVAEVVRLLDDGLTVLAPTHDGGTSLIAGRGRFPFAYGPSSFVRHARAAPDAAVVASPGLAHDLDTPADLELTRRLAPGRWVDALLAPGGPSITVRRMVADDAEDFRRLRLESLRLAPDAFGSTFDDEAPVPLDRWQGFIAEGSAEVYAAYLGPEAVGMEFVHADDAGSLAIGGMWVTRWARGLGAGRAMMAAGYEWARERGIGRARLAVTLGNDAARALYESEGFVATGRTGSVREGSELRFEWLERQIGSTP